MKTNAKTPMRQYTIRLPDPVLADLEYLSSQDRLHFPTVSHIIRLCIDEALPKIKKRRSQSRR